MVEISGLATGPYTVLAPITGRPCYYHRTLVWEWKQCGKNKQWVKVAGECMHVPFFIDDNTGRMLIDPRGAELELHRDFEQEFCDSFFTTKEPAPENVRNFLACHGVITNNKIKVEEFCIKPKNALFILGTLAENNELELTPQPIRDDRAIGTLTLGKISLSLRPSNPGLAITKEAIRESEPGFAGSDGKPHEVVRLAPEPGPTTTSEMSQQQKIAAALIKAGISNPAAWSAAGVGSISTLTPSDYACSNGEGTQNFDPHPPVVLKKGDNNTAFLISWRSQQEVARTLGWKSAVMIWGGPALALLSLYVLLNITQVVR